MADRAAQAPGMAGAVRNKACVPRRTPPAVRAVRRMTSPLKRQVSGSSGSGGKKLPERFAGVTAGEMESEALDLALDPATNLEHPEA